jgi:hypothetical protein
MFTTGAALPRSENRPVQAVIWRLTAHSTAASRIRLVLSDLRMMLPTVSVDAGSTTFRLIATGGPNSYESMAPEAQPHVRSFLPNHDETASTETGHRVPRYDDCAGLSCQPKVLVRWM